MLPRTEILLLLDKTRKLPRLALMGFLPLMISQTVSMPYHLSWTLATWGIMFLAFFWLEGLTLSARIIYNIEEYSKYYKVIDRLEDMEFDRIG